MQKIARSPVPIIVSKHVEDAAALRGTRTHLVRAPHVKLTHLGRLDARLSAHLDGIAVAGAFGAQLAAAALESPGPGQVFVAAVVAIQSRQSASLDKLISLVEALPEVQQALISAFGWLSAQSLKGTVSELLQAAVPLRRRVGIAACALHRVDPRSVLNAEMSALDTPLRASALRCAGELGRRDLLQGCVEHLRDSDSACTLWAAWSAALLGDRGPTIASLRQLSVAPSPHRKRALQLVLKILDVEGVNAMLRSLAKEPANRRALLQGTGVAGDPYYIPWLIDQMHDAEFARLAGESFSMITGLDLAYLDLERRPPQNVDGGPNDDPADSDVAMDPDDGLPWPDPERIRDWWLVNQARFISGRKYFMGEPVSRTHCVRVLKEGFQRQRIAAAEYLCLLQPGTPLFNTAAPAWRQERLLAKLQ